MQNEDINLSSSSDSDLLRQFLQDANESAFAEIVYRYQQLVMSVCRRILGENDEAEDAFQATFLALARRPRQIRRLTTLGSWLYTVAWRTSWKLVKARLRTATGPLMADLTDNSNDPFDRVAAAHDYVVLDEELHRLPSRYRDVLVMTYFADRTSQQIAADLNLSKGTVDGRIRNARNLLRTRLARRGIALGALTAAAAVCRSGEAVAATGLVNSTIHLGTQVLGGASLTSGAEHLSLTDQTPSIMATSRLFASIVVSLTVALGAVGLSGHGQQPAASGKQPKIHLQNLIAGPQDTKMRAHLNKTRVTEVVVTNDDKATNDVPPMMVEDLRKRVRVLEEHLATMARKNARLEHVIEESPDKPTQREMNETVAEAISATKTEVENELERLTRLLLAHEIDPSGKISRERFKPWPPDAGPAEHRMYQILDLRVPLMNYPGQTPLAELLNPLAEWVNTTLESNPSAGRFEFHVDTAELALAGIDSLENVVARDIHVESITLRNALALILETTAEPELTYVIRNEVMVITTRSRAEHDDSMTLRMYDVADTQLSDSVDKLIVELTPGLWKGSASAHIVNGKLVIRQTFAGHHKVVRLLNQLTGEPGTSGIDAEEP